MGRSHIGPKPIFYGLDPNPFGTMNMVSDPDLRPETYVDPKPNLISRHVQKKGSIPNFSRVEYIDWIYRIIGYLVATLSPLFKEEKLRVLDK